MATKLTRQHKHLIYIIIYQGDGYKANHKAQILDLDNNLSR